MLNSGGGILDELGVEFWTSGESWHPGEPARIPESIRELPRGQTSNCSEPRLLPSIAQPQTQAHMGSLSFDGLR
jgi:hypothetical protein